jgi:hypothetical protein
MTMTTDPVRPPTDPLEAYFAAARATPPAVADDLMARVLADAAAECPVRPAPAPLRGVVRESLWSQLVAAVGGRGALAGMAAAGLAGVWIGFAQPVALPFVPDAGTVELFPSDLDLLGDVLATDTLSEG